MFGMKLKLKVTHLKKIALKLRNMQSKVRALDELAQMKSGGYLVRMASQEAGEQVDHCFGIDVRRRVFLDGADTLAIRLRKSTKQLRGMNKMRPYIAEGLMIA